MRNLDELVARGRKLVRQPVNSGAGDWYRISNADGGAAEAYIYGVIGSDWNEGDVTASSFVRDLRNVTAPVIDLHLNSPGGLVWDGIAIYSALLNHPATVNVHVDGIAASAASFVAMAGDTITMEKPAKMMIHDAQGVAIGNAADMAEMAQLLDETSDTIAGIYADRTGADVSQWRDAMKAETWFSASQAVEAGLADQVANDATATPENSASQMVKARHRVRAR